jgi:hypothetical protein
MPLIAVIGYLEGKTLIKQMNNGSLMALIAELLFASVECSALSL